MSLNNVVYHPIDATTVRLLRISGGKNGFIAGELEHFSLDSKERPAFRTLSYVWGAKSYNQKAIILNERPFSVLQSLYPFLELICNTSSLSSDWWWIDSICINQADDQEAKMERSSQVHLMERIYRSSKMTVGWLGGANGEGGLADDGEAAMDFLYVLLGNRRRLRSPENGIVVRELTDRATWTNLERFLHRPWWRRVWTLQEHIIPAEFGFYCGTKWTRRDDFEEATSLISACIQVDDALITWDALNPAWNRRRLLMWHQRRNPMSLVALMAYVSDCKATDPRDRIYSLLGLATDKGLGDPPDYNSDVDKVYSEFVKLFVEKYQSLDVICFVHIFNQYPVEVDAVRPQWPSWVPDWKAEVKPWIMPVMASQSAGPIGNFRPRKQMTLGDDARVYAAAGRGCPPEVIFSDDFRFLTCKGILVDYVDGIGGLNPVSRCALGKKEFEEEEGHDCINSTSRVNSPEGIEGDGRALRCKEVNTAESSQMIDGISRCLVLNRKDRYLTYVTPPHYFSKDFQSLCLTALTEPTKAHPQFVDWFQLNRSLYIRGYRFEELCRSAEIDRLDLSHLNTAEAVGERSFESRFNDTTREMARRLITTDGGHIGMAPYRARKGDCICVVLGCSIPLVLRRRKDGSSYEVIGECYLHGFMDGEVLREVESGRFKIEDFRLS